MNLNLVPLLSALPEGRVFGLDKQTFIDTGIQLLNACILAVVLGFILYKPVRDFMRQRTDRIVGQINEAKDKMAEAEELKAEYEKKMAEIELERIKILEAARIAATEKSRKIIDEARGEAATIRQRAEESIIQEKERLHKETRLHIIEVSSLIAEKIVVGTIDNDTQNRLFDEAVAELEEATWLN